jgi:hypothetical protein
MKLNYYWKSLGGNLIKFDFLGVIGLKNEFFNNQIGFLNYFHQKSRCKF